MAVMLVTSVGELVIDLFTDQCPLATKNFLKLCKIKYYNNCLFHSVQKDYIVQTGDPTATGKGGDSIYKLLYGDQARFFDDEIHPTLKHDKVGIVAMASAGENANASQFYITTRAELDYLDEKHTVFGEVGEGLEALTRINEAFVDDNNRPYKNIRIKHTIILEDPFDDPTGLSDLIPDQSPELKPPAEGEEVRLEDDWVPMDETMDPEGIEKSIRKKEAQSRAVVLEMIGDLPEADMKPPENVLFVCKLNPVTEEGDLELIFGRFGKVKSADIIRDFKTGDSLCYAFIEFETEEACETAYFKMDNVLIDDRRIHVDFSQSVSHLWNRYRKQGKTGRDGQSGKGCFKCGEVGHLAKECPNDGAEQKEAPTEKPKYTIKDTGGQRGHANKRYEMVFADDENPQDQRVSNKSRQGRRQDKDRDSHHGSEHHSRMEREHERPQADRDANRRTERESDRSRVDRDVQTRKMQNGENRKNAKRPAPTDQQDGDERKPKKKRDPAESELRRSIDMCSKFADAMGAIDIYDRVVTEGKTSFNQYSYNVLLYLCSSGATSSLKRGKSGNIEKRKSNVQEYKLEGVAPPELKAEQEVELTNDQKEVCLQRGFAVYEAMKLQGVPPNEATFTAVARLAVAKEDGDLAFDMVKQMTAAKLSPRLRSYSPALHTYCKLKNVEKAFEVDEHMQSAGVRPEESELEALLTLSAGAGLEDKVYSILLRIRTTVRGLSPSTVGVIKLWFESSTGGNVGSSIWDTLPSQETVKAAYDSRGGGWHGLGWLGRGPWEVKSSVLDASGVCQECGEQLVTIDIDPQETKLFVNSLSELACQRESKNNEFKKFQGWLDGHGPFDVIVDGANVGLFNQNFGEGGFNFHQLNSVVEGIKEKVGSKREPLVLLHHRRTRGGPANSPFAIKTLNRWQDAHALYTTPTGSNDDWYWLYAAVRYKCILVTNDEMRDHLFQLLGSDFFPKWKERHQVRFSLSKEGPVFHMPPPYSILIQESVSGSWHIPKSCNDDVSSSREWLCITRTSHTSPEIVKVEEKLNCLLTGAEETGTDGKLVVGAHNLELKDSKLMAS